MTSCGGNSFLHTMLPSSMVTTLFLMAESIFSSNAFFIPSFISNSYSKVHSKHFHLRQFSC